MITAADIERKLNPKIVYQYDSDEDVEGGTWEHKKRAAEMKKTAQRAKELTEMAHRKHHMADYLPKEELEKLYEKVTRAWGSPSPALCTSPLLGCERSVATSTTNTPRAGSIFCCLCSTKR